MSEIQQDKLKIKNIIEHIIKAQGDKLPTEWNEFIDNLGENTNSQVQFILLSLIMMFRHYNLNEGKYIKPVNKGLSILNMPYDSEYNPKELLGTFHFGTIRSNGLQYEERVTTKLMKSCIANTKTSEVLRIWKNASGKYEAKIISNSKDYIYDTKKLLYYCRTVNSKSYNEYYDNVVDEILKNINVNDINISKIGVVEFYIGNNKSRTESTPKPELMKYSSLIMLGFCKLFMKNQEAVKIGVDKINE